ncbi:MAG: LysR family transcriptional regulator [Myxococcota bacterium]
MNSLNLNHLRYFWLTAREGSLTRASRRLQLAPSTVSTQIKALEEAIGQPLFDRRGRSLVLTAHGEVVRQYADEIFALSEELVQSLRDANASRPAARLRVGVSAHLPKLVAYRLVSPVMKNPQGPVHLSCFEDQPDRLVADLAVNQLDVVLSDAPVGLASEVRVESLLIGESPVALMGHPDLAKELTEDFPRSLADAPVLLPDQSSAMRRLLERFFEREAVRPRVVGEFADSALLASFGMQGAGVFPTSAIVAQEVAAQYHVERIGTIPEARERFYAIARPGRLEEAPISLIVESGREVLESA